MIAILSGLEEDLAHFARWFGGLYTCQEGKMQARWREWQWHNWIDDMQKTIDLVDPILKFVFIFILVVTGNITWLSCVAREPIHEM